jgi:phospholipase/lecithinase/hemolysin
MRRVFTLAVASLLILPLSSFANSITQLVVFGDSLSDTGNLYIATGGADPAAPGYSGGLFTDGPGSVPSTSTPVGVWVQQLAGMLGVASPAPVLAGGGGTDYAFWAGANDIFNGVSPQTAVSNLTASINTLYGDGARDFLWLNMPPLGDTPDGFALGSSESAALNLLSESFNADWTAAINSLDSHDPGIDVVGVNVYGLVESMLSNPSAYGFTNVDTPAQGLSVNPNTYLFWDGVHPTTEGHFWVANLADHDLTTTPESSTFSLFGIGLLAGAFILRGRYGAPVRPRGSA